jgi:predicted N-acetyltransferase YhbS
MRTIRRVDEEMLEQILQSTCAIWHEGLTPRAYAQWNRGQMRSAWGARHLQRVALGEGTTVLSSAKRYELTAVLDGRRLGVCGIGALFTPDEHRGRGYARELVERLTADAEREGASFALLFSEIGADYYAGLGFVPIPTRDLSLRVTESTRYGAPATLVRAGEERDVGDIVALGRARADQFRFHLDRDADLFRFALARRRLLAGLGRAGAREILFFIAEEGASAVAYVVISVIGREWTIEECGDRDPAGARVGAVLQALIARDPAERRPEIRAWLPSGFVPPQVTIAGATSPREVMMIRPLGAAALPALGPEDVLYWRADVF